MSAQAECRERHGLADQLLCGQGWTRRHASCGVSAKPAACLPGPLISESLITPRAVLVLREEETTLWVSGFVATVTTEATGLSQRFCITPLRKSKTSLIPFVTLGGITLCLWDS